MADQLSNDLIVEIISKLPLRNLFRCKCLNKFFYESISKPSFLNKVHKNKITYVHLVKHNFLSSIRKDIFSIDLNCTAPRIPKLFRNSCDALSIMDSCNGILLLRTRYLYRDYYIVFNPITCGVANVLLSKKQDTTSWLVAPCTGLVVEVDITSSSPSFKLVEVLSREDDQDIVRFNVVVPCKNGTYLETPWDFPGLGFNEFALSVNHKPVYLDGCLYWIERYGQKVLVFDAEKKKARIINGPATDNIFEIRFCAWFGVACGSLSFVRALPTEVVIDAYDPVSDNWKIQHKYLQASCALRDIPYHGLPVFYDGQRIFFQSVIEYKNIFMFDGSKNKWMVIGMVPGCTDPTRPYIPFSPTLAKVSNVYLHDHMHVHSEMDIHLSSIKENLLELRKLF